MTAPAPVEVLLVDDSAVIRRLLTEVLGAAPDLARPVTASNGLVALERLEAHVFDVVVLDVEMPVLDGLATLERIRTRWPDLPVVMFSTLTTRGAMATLDALAKGATDYVTKPSGVSGVDEARGLVAAELLSVVRSCAALGRQRRRVPARPPSVAPATARTVTAAVATAPALQPAPGRARHGRCEALVIASSTGGPNALTEIIPKLPRDLPVPILVVQHMPALFTRLLAERLDARSALAVREGTDGTAVEPGNVYVAPGGEHMVVRRSPGRGVVVARDDGPPENSCKPSADVLFRSAASVWGPAVLGLVLTGMGHDGLAGCRALTEAGASVYVQDEASSVVWGMPGAVAKEGLAGAELPLEAIAERLAHELRRPAGVLAG